VEPVERVELLAVRRELDRLSGDGANGECRATARVAVELREDDAVEVDPLWNAIATLTASWPVIASRTRSVFVGFASSCTAASSSMSASSICRRPAVSRMTRSRPSAVARAIPSRTALTGSERSLA